MTFLYPLTLSSVATGTVARGAVVMTVAMDIVIVTVARDIGIVTVARDNIVVTVTRDTIIVTVVRDIFIVTVARDAVTLIVVISVAVVTIAMGAFIVTVARHADTTFVTVARDDSMLSVAWDKISWFAARESGVVVSLYDIQRSHACSEYPNFATCRFCWKILFCSPINQIHMISCWLIIMLYTTSQL